MDDDREEGTIRRPGTGSFFQMKRLWITVIVIAVVAVFWGMGGQRTAQDKAAHVYSAEQRQQKEADRIAGFGRRDKAENKAATVSR